MSTKRPKIRRPRPWSLPPARTLSLDNGVEVLVYERPGQYVVAAGLLLDIPLTAERPDREGVAGVTAAALDEGTRSHPGTDFADAVEGCGAVLSASVGQSHTTLTLDVPGARLAGAAALLLEAAAEPTLTDDDVERHRRIRVSQVEQQLATSAERANHGFRHAVISPRNRAQRLAGGEPDTLAAVTGPDARAHHARWFGPRGATLVLAGDFPAAALHEVVEVFEGWARPGQATGIHEQVTSGPAGAYVIDRPGSVQADVRWGWFTIDRTDPRWAPLQIATHALGGAYLSRLNRALREERGFTYGASLVNQPLRSGGLTYAQGSFRNEVLGEALALLPALVDVGAEPLTTAEVTRARDYLIGVSPLRYATASGLCDGVLGLLGAGLGPDFIDAQLEAWRRVTPDTASWAAGELLPPAEATLVVVGDAGVLEPQVRAAGWEPTVVAGDAAPERSPAPA